MYRTLTISVSRAGLPYPLRTPGHRRLLTQGVSCSGNGMPDDPTTHGVVAGMWSSLSGAGRFISRCGAGILVDTVGFPLASSVVVALHVLMVRRPPK